MSADELRERIRAILDPEAREIFDLIEANEGWRREAEREFREQWLTWANAVVAEHRAP